MANKKFPFAPCDVKGRDLREVEDKIVSVNRKAFLQLFEKSGFDMRVPATVEVKEEVVVLDDAPVVDDADSVELSDISD